MENLRSLKTLQRGGKSKYVKLYETSEGVKIIKKAYDKKQEKQVFRFNKEIEFMTHLKNCPFVPKIISVDHEKLVIYMSYVGNSIDESKTENQKQKTKAKTQIKDNKTKMQEKMKSLHLDWNLMRHRDGKPNYNIYLGNATLMNGEIYIIDFGSPHYKIVGPAR